MKLTLLSPINCAHILTLSHCYGTIDENYSAPSHSLHLPETDYAVTGHSSYRVFIIITIFGTKVSGTKLSSKTKKKCRGMYIYVSAKSTSEGKGR